MRRTSRFVVLLGSLIASAGWAEAGDRTASDFYVGDPATAGETTPANRGKAAPETPAAPPAQRADAPLALVPAAAGRGQRTAAEAAGHLPVGHLATARPAGAQLRDRPAAAKRATGPVATLTAPRHGVITVPPLPPQRPVTLAQAAPAAALVAPVAPAAASVKTVDPTTPPSAAHPPQAARLNDRAKTPAEVHAAVAATSTGAAAAARKPAAVAAAPTGHIEKAAPTLADLLARHAEENGVPLRLAKAVVTIESRGNVRASHGGALGLMQIKPQTARSVGFNGGAAGLFEPDINLRYGMKILGQAFKASGGDLCKALVHYQSGHVVTRMNAANRAYCQRARAVMAGA